MFLLGKLSMIFLVIAIAVITIALIDEAHE